MAGLVCNRSVSAAFMLGAVEHALALLHPITAIIPTPMLPPSPGLRTSLDAKSMETVYGQGWTSEDVLSGDVSPPPGMEGLLSTLKEVRCGCTCGSRASCWGSSGCASHAAHLTLLREPVGPMPHACIALCTHPFAEAKAVHCGAEGSGPLPRCRQCCRRVTGVRSAHARSMTCPKGPCMHDARLDLTQSRWEGRHSGAGKPQTRLFRSLRCFQFTIALRTMYAPLPLPRPFHPVRHCLWRECPDVLLQQPADWKQLWESACRLGLRPTLHNSNSHTGLGRKMKLEPSMHGSNSSRARAGGSGGDHRVPSPLWYMSAMQVAGHMPPLRMHRHSRKVYWG